MDNITQSEIKACLNKSPEEIVDFFKAKGCRITWDWQDDWQECQAKSFTIAKVMEMDILQDIKNELVRALDSGETLQTFKSNLESVLAAKGWWKGKKEVTNPDTGETAEIELGSNRRMRQIFETNLTTSYRAGQYKQQWENRDSRPWWMYVCKMLPTSREEHKALHGKVFRYDDPFWDSFYPPNGFNCRCDVIPLTEDEIENLEHYTLQPKLDKDGQQIVVNGIPQYEHVLTKIERCESTPTTLTQRDAQVTIDGKQMKYKRAFYQDGTMANAVSTDRGWNYNPGKAVYFEPDLRKYDKPFVDAYLKMQAEFMKNLSKKNQISVNIAKTLTSVVNGAKIINNSANVVGATNSLKSAEDYIEDIKQFDWWKGLKEEDAKFFEEDLKKVSAVQLKTIATYCRTMEVDFYYPKWKATEFCSGNKLFVYISKTDERSRALGFKLDMRVFLHECGHWLDSHVLKTKSIQDKMPELRKKLKEDIFNWVNQTLRDLDLEKKDMNENPITIKTVADLERLTHWSKEYEQDIQRLCALRTVLVHLSETKNGISDLFEATTKGIIYDSYGHGKSYWKNNALEHEAMAHLFDARGCGGIKAEKMKRYLPLTYQYFTESIEKLGL